MSFIVLAKQTELITTICNQMIPLNTFRTSKKELPVSFYPYLMVRPTEIPEIIKPFNAKDGTVRDNPLP